MTKHVWVLDEHGNRDNFQLEDDENFHNGPRCVNCGERFCEHCQAPDARDDCEPDDPWNDKNILDTLAKGRRRNDPR